MRGVVFLALMLALLPMVVARPFVGVLLWCWIAFMNPHRAIWGPVADLPWAAIVFGATAIGLVLARSTERVVPNAMSWMVMALMACITVTSFTALGPPADVWAKWEFVFKVGLGLLLTASLLSSRERVHALAWVIALSLGYYGVKGGIFTVLHGGSYRVVGPPDSMIADNNHLAVGLLVAVPLMNYLRLQSRHAAVRWGLAAAMVLTTLGALGSHSRGALVALVAGALVFWLRSRHKLVMGAALAACVAGGIAIMPDRWADRMESISAYEEDRSASERLLLWRTSFALALDRPLVGSGFRGPYTREVVDRVDPDAPARAVHSIWFELLGEHGFPTFFVWFGMLALGGWYAWRLPRVAAGRPDLAWAADFGRMAQVSLVVYAVGGSFLSLSYWDVSWTLLVVVAAAHTLARRAVLEQLGSAGTAATTWRQRTRMAAPRRLAPAHDGARP